MTSRRIRNGYLHFSRKIKKKRKLTKRKRTRRQKDGAAFLGPILASAVAPVLDGIIGKIFQNDVREEKTLLAEKQKKDTELKEDEIKKVVLF